MADEVLDVALTLLKRGYTPLRIERGEKMPRAQGWQIDVPTEDKLTRAFARPSNIGLRVGDPKPDSTCLLAIDVDLEVPEIIRCVERAIGMKVPVKKGKKGATYFVRMDRQLKTHKIYWVRDEKKTAAIDVLCRGAQTVVPPSIHPETQLPYQWISGTPLTEIDYKELPVFTPMLLDEIRGFCKNPDDAIYQLNDMEWLGAGGGGNTHDICLAAVSSMVARKWTDDDIMTRIQRAKREACEHSGVAYDWPEAEKVIQEWIDSARDKKFDVTAKLRVEDVPIEMINNYVYVVELDRMLDRQKGMLLSIHTFNNLHARDIPKPWATMLVHPDLIIVDKLTYAPGQPKICQERSLNSESPMTCFNMFYAPELEPEEGDVSPFLNLVYDVFDHDAGAINHVLSFLAQLVQFPGERINHALVIQGSQGIGKDSIVLAMEKVLGRQNCNTVTLAHIESQFNDWAFGKQLINFSEVLAAGRRAIYNKCKNYVTDELLTVNTKFLPLQRLPNRANYIFVTNYKHALSIDPSDRRFWVWYSKMKAKGPGYYSKFYTWMADTRSGNYLLHFLLNYDTSKFNPKAPPPMTEAKKSMIQQSASEVEQFLRMANEARTWPMACDLVCLTHLVSALRPVMRVSQSMVSEALDHIAGEDTEISTRPYFGDKRPRLRAIRNYDKWKEASPKELGLAYRIPLPPMQGEIEGSYDQYQDVREGPDDEGAPDSPDRAPDF